MSGNSTCPDPVAVEAEVFRLTSAKRRAQHLPGTSVRVTDSGTSYRIEIQKAGEAFVKTYADPARECEKRVRFAAVYVVMTLMPPNFDEPPEQESTDSTSGAAQRGEQADSANASSNDDADGPDADQNRAASGERSRRAGAPIARPDTTDDAPDPKSKSRRPWALELGLSGAQSWSTSEVPRIASWGGELLGEVGSGSVRGVVAVELAPRARFDIRGVLAKMSAVTTRTGVRLADDDDAFALFADAHIVAAWRRVEGESSVTTSPESVWEWGALVGISAGYRLRPAIMPLASLRLTFFPDPSQLQALPRGKLGKLPNLWFGGLLGVRF